MNRTLTKTALLLCAAVCMSACDEGKYNDLECDSAVYEDNCLDATHFMTCYNSRLAVVTCESGFYCELEESGKATCKNPYLTDSCNEADTRCSGSTVQTCTGGSWINAPQPCEFGCENGGCKAKTPEEPECSESKPCADADKTCVDGKCEVVEPECSENKPCADAGKTCVDGKCEVVEPECSENKPCADADKTCVEGKCEVVEPECSESKPCADADKTCVDGKCEVVKDECGKDKPCSNADETCIYGECQKMTPCESNADCTEFNMLCHSDKCVFAQDVSCEKNSDCGSGFFCDINKCLADDACSLTHTCPDSHICHKGHCQDEQHPVCSKTAPCTGADQICVQGKCVTCTCTGEHETCDLDGNCVSTVHSSLKDITEGDVCTYSPEFGFCDGNIRFSCTQQSGEDKHYVRTSDCGANICTESLTEDLGCHEPCTVKGDFYGECLQQYYEITNTFINYSFKTECTESADGRLIWTFTEGYETCAAGCTNGSCDFVPSDYGQTCEKGSYADHCTDQWAMTCVTEQTSQAGTIVGEDCAHYSEGDRAYSCAVDAEEGLVDCILDCSEENETIHVCHKYPNYPGVYSDTRRCAPKADGGLGYFLTGYEECGEAGCDETTGLCR